MALGLGPVLNWPGATGGVGKGLREVCRGKVDVP